jgi:hypothetical protein
MRTVFRVPVGVDDVMSPPSPHTSPFRHRAGRLVTRLGLVTLLAAGVAAATASPAVAGPQPGLSQCLAPSTTTKDGQAAAEYLSQKMATLRQQGLTVEAIDAVLAKEGVINESGRPAPKPSANSSQGNIGVWAPTIYKDSCSSTRYVTAYWDFNSMSAMGNDAGNCDYCNVGGQDAMGVAFNRAVGSAAGYSSATWGASSAFPASSGRMWPGSANTTGVVFQGQDHYCHPIICGGSNDYDFFHGYIVYTIGSIGCGALQAFSLYGHSWGGTQLSGVGVGPWSVSIEWTDWSAGWNAGSQPTSPGVRGRTEPMRPPAVPHRVRRRSPWGPGLSKPKEGPISDEHGR